MADGGGRVGGAKLDWVAEKIAVGKLGGMMK